MNDKYILISTKDEFKEFIAETVKEQLVEFFNKGKAPDNRLLSRKEVAKLLGISLPTLHRWTMDGTIKAFRVGRSVRYKMSGVEDALKNIQSIKYLQRKNW